MSLATTYEQASGDGKIRVGLLDALRILYPYFREKIGEQVRSVLPVVAYLFVFQTAILRRGISDAAAITISITAVILGLMLFMEGLRLWLMPVGEAIGNGLPRRTTLPTIIAFAFLVGVGATFAEPAIGALKAAGADIDPVKAPMLHALLNARSGLLAILVAAGVGLAVVLGTLRFLSGWRLKTLLTPIVLSIVALTFYAGSRPELSSIVGLAWDFGAVIVGPITVPLVLGLGLGVSKASGKSDSGSGFGAVTLISLAPIVAVLVVAVALHLTGGVTPVTAAAPASPDGPAVSPGFLSNAFVQVMVLSGQAILPLCVFLFLVQAYVLRERIARGDELALGLAFALAGLILFNLGLSEGLTPLGDQIGNVAPGAFSKIMAGDPPQPFGPLYGSLSGSVIILFFAFFLGYGATLAEPALGALGAQVQEVTVGAFRKSVLMHSVAFGVGLGMALGIAKVIYGLPAAWLLAPFYLILLALSLLSTEEFVAIGWDSGAVTTGPFTVPLVVAMGLGLGRNIPGVIEGFGILALASAGPILTVLCVGLLIRRKAEAGT